MAGNEATAGNADKKAANGQGRAGDKGMPRQRQSAAARAYEQIKEKILMGEIAPLQRIDEQTLREELAVGRTPIREAIQHLSYDGLVTVVPFRGTIASGIDLSDLDQIMEERIPLEILGSRLAAERATREDVDKLRKRLEAYGDIAKLCEEGDFVDLLRLDEEMHQGITDLAQNKFLSRDVQRLRDLTWRFHILFYRRRRPTPDQSFNNYEELIQALADGDPDEMERAVRAHFVDYLPTGPR